MNKEIQFEPATSKDAEDILRIQKLAFQSEAEIHNNFNIPPLIQSLDSVYNDFSSFEFYKALYGGKIVGTIKIQLLDKHKLWIGRLVVDPEYQNRGIGKFMMSEIESRYKFVKIFELFTGEKSARNIKFYKALGYRITEYFHEPEHENIILVKMVKYSKSGQTRKS
jgi:ribosomal protein S18 acetylase RimI-like enzyme